MLLRTKVKDLKCTIQKKHVSALWVTSHGVNLDVIVFIYVCGSKCVWWFYRFSVSLQTHRHPQMFCIRKRIWQKAEMIWLFWLRSDKACNVAMFRCTKLSFVRFSVAIIKSQIWSHFSLFELRGRTSHCSDLNIFCASSSHTSCKYWQGMTLSK